MKAEPSFLSPQPPPLRRAFPAHSAALRALGGVGGGEGHPGGLPVLARRRPRRHEGPLPHYRTPQTRRFGGKVFLTRVGKELAL